MPKVHVYNKTGEILKDIDLHEEIFNVKPEMGVIHQVVVAQQANARQVLGHTKGKGDVRGGGKKPWKQKGTGRARHGSIRSPLWVGGGITFGPTSDRNFTLKVNKKMKKKALFMTLTDKVFQEKFIVLDNIDIASKNTKEIKNIFAKLPVERKLLVVISEQNENIWLSVRNIPNIKVIMANSLNVVDVLGANAMIVVEPALSVIEKTYLK